MYEIASSDLKWAYNRAQAERMILVAQEHFDTGSGQEDALLEVNGTEIGLARGALRKELLGKLMPDWFYSQPSNLPIPLPGASNNNSKGWDCNEEKCG